jgi:hypothetical protein
MLGEFWLFFGRDHRSLRLRFQVLPRTKIPVSVPSDNPSVNQHDRDGPRSHERGHLCGLSERAAVERHAYRQKNHAQKARAKDGSWSWEIVHGQPADRAPR